MKTFKDLEHKSHPNWTGTQAKMFFGNWYWVSVIKAEGSYGRDKWLYEMAILEWNKEDRTIYYDAPITDDVLWHLTEEEVTEYMAKVQAL